MSTPSGRKPEHTLSSEVISSLGDSLAGSVLTAGSAGYDEARTIWNAMIDRQPAAIVRCRNADDVARALAFAREQGLEVTVRGAGHNIAGNSVCDGGLMIDLSGMKAVHVDGKTARARIEPGATLADVDAATQALGLATPLGINSTTGIAGLTLGGGFGWLTRLYGMTVDNLVGADVVTVEGEKVHASEKENSDLFWGLRGGGGNFGIVTEFEFQLHEVGPNILAGLIVFPFAEARTVLSKYREFSRTAPRELNVWAVLRKAPPLPFLPEEVHGKEVAILAVFFVGDEGRGQQLIAPLREFGTPVGEHLGVQPYTAWQQAFDPLLTPGARNYWKSHNFTELADGAIDAVIEYAGQLPSPQCEIFIAHLAGAPNEVAADQMAWSARDTNHILNVHSRWDEAGDDRKCMDWARAFFRASQPYASAGAYVNFMTEEEGDRVAAAYGPNYSRLVELKRKYDPENVLHWNQNVKP